MSSDPDQEGGKSHRTEIIVALIGLAGVLGGALFTNWDKIFSPNKQPVPVVGPDNASPTPSSLVVPSKRLPESPAPPPLVSPQQIPFAAGPPPLPIPSKETPLSKATEIKAKNTSRSIGRDPRTSQEIWEWTIYIDASPENLSKIKCVQYTLHYTFRLPPQKICNEYNRFAFSATGYGTFNIPILVIFKDDRTMELSHELEFR